MIHESICPRCGEPSPLGVCDRCRRGMAVLLQTPEAVELTVCPVCGSHPVRGRWQKDDEPIEDLISDAVAGEARIHQDLLDPEISISVKKKNATQYRATVTLSGKFGEIPAEEAKTVEATVRQATCERCSRMAGNYYEATVQVRGSAGAPAPEEVEECRNIAERATEAAFERGDRLSFIQETKVVKGGIDLVVGSTQQGRYIARAIHDRFGGTSGESYKLVGVKDGKNVHRTNILVRLPRLKAGDLVWARGTFLEVRRFEGKRTACRSLLDGNRVYLSIEESEDAPVVGNRSSAERCVVVAADRDVLEVLDPVSYRTVSASRPGLLTAGVGDEVEFLRFRGELVLLPPQERIGGVEPLQPPPQSY
ncbi:60S ribosomal export protein NMD3 [Candidatus Methanocrinis natronophilus]|uniref:NMD3-related protein n=1 Tax=Candidatus Methanocrinis natronophilus TaxID=3033396 RepID=A0ABT5X609_9EURY|nr:NMD3-related protein [Candidatus Methanocrinis natronophilus]MDF0590124.1 NMD3-related protein [Candidatus Methanocrinis natronophilus]